MSLEGNVEYRCDVRPVITEEYHNLMKGRVTKATVKNRYLQPIDSAEVLTNNPHGRDYDIKVTSNIIFFVLILIAQKS